MAFTDVEMAILSQLAYCGSTKEVSKSERPSTAVQTGDTLYEVLLENQEWLRSKLGDAYNDAIQRLMTKAENSEYTVVLAEDDKYGTGFAAIAIKDPDNTVTVATRGTEGFSCDYDSRKDVVADVELAYSVSTAQQKEMENFMQALENKGYDGYYFTGHSLGGNLALYGAITFEPSEKVKGVVTFNAPGFNDKFINKYSREITALYGRTNNYQNEYDSVSSIMTVPGPTTIIESSRQVTGFLNSIGRFFLGDHGLSDLTVSDDGFCAKEHQSKSIQTHVIHSLVEVLIKDTWLPSFVEIAICFGRFTCKLLEDLKGYIKNAFTGDSFNSYGTYIKVDTDTLRNYANRLRKVNRRIVSLDKRLDALYTKVGLLDLWNLLQAAALTQYNRKLEKCAGYLDETAYEFEEVERSISL